MKTITFAIVMSLLPSLIMSMKNIFIPFNPLLRNCFAPNICKQPMIYPQNLIVKAPNLAFGMENALPFEMFMNSNAQPVNKLAAVEELLPPEHIELAKNYGTLPRLAPDVSTFLPASLPRNNPFLPAASPISALSPPTSNLLPPVNPCYNKHHFLRKIPIPPPFI